MAKRGGSRHYIRITAPGTLPIVGRKSVRWMLSPNPGAHKRSGSLSLGVLLRDVMGIAGDMKEVKRLLVGKMVNVDGKAICEPRYSVGLMDIIELPKAGKAYRMQIVDGRLGPKEIKAAEAKAKLCKVTSKKIIAGKKFAIGTHDGRTLIADNNVKVGATLKMGVPDFKLKEQLPLAPGAKCLVTDGTHAGEMAVLEKVIERTGSMDSEAKVKAGKAEFVTLTKYLFAVDNEFA